MSDAAPTQAATPAAPDVDDYGAAIEQMDTPPGAPETAGAAAPARKYPPFRADEWRDNPYAITVNSVVDRFLDLESGTATKCNFGEAYVYAITCYAGSAMDNMPPWLVAVMATVTLALAWWRQRKDKQSDDANLDRDVDDLHARMAAARGAAPTEKV